MDWDSAGIGAVITAAFAGLFAWLTQRSRGKVEESVSVRGQWEKLTDGLAQRLSTVEKEFADYRIEMAAHISQIERRHAEEIAEMRREHNSEMKAMKELNLGLQRQIIQSSRSTAQMMGDPGGMAESKARKKERGE